MFSLDSLKNTAIAGALAFSIGLAFGYYVKSQFVKADQFSAVTEAQHQTAKDIEHSLEIDSAVETKVTALTSNVESARKAVSIRLTQPTGDAKEAQNETTPQSRSCDWSLDLGTVSLLNSARAGTPVDSAFLGDATSKIPSGIEFADFADNDLQVVELYHELAARHDALVDYVESKIKQQAGK